MKTMDLVGKIMDFESGQMDSEEAVIEFFQELVDTGLAWQLQGSYGRTAQALIESGRIRPRGKEGSNV